MTAPDRVGGEPDGRGDPGAARCGTRARPARAGARSAACLVAVLALVGVLLAPAPVAAAGSGRGADGTADPVRVVLAGLSPSVLRPGQVLEVRGRVVNDGDEPVVDAHARLRLSRSTTLSRADLARLAAGEVVRDGSAVEGVRTAVGDLAPGASAPFVLRVPADQLGLGATAVHPLAVELRGEPVDAGGAERAEQRLGTARTQLSWAADPAQVEPTSLAWLWPLADVPHRRADGAFLDDDLAASVVRGGRLDALLRAAERRPPAADLTLVVDPMLLDDLDAMRRGYQVVSGDDGDGGLVEGTGGARAAAFLDRLRALLQRTSWVALPYGDPDVEALRAEGQEGLLDAARARGGQVLRTVLPGAPRPLDAALPPAGTGDEGTLTTLLRGAPERALVLEDTALPAPEVPYTPTGRASLRLAGGAHPVALADAALSALVPRADAPPGPGGTVPTAGEQLARFVAETEMLVLERPGIPRAVAVAPPRLWRPAPGTAGAVLAATAAAPWLAPGTLPGLLAVPVPEDVQRTGPQDPPGGPAPLPPEHLAAVERVRTRVDALAEVLAPAQAPRRRAGAGPAAGAGQDGAAQDGAGQDGAAQDGAAQDGAAQDGAAQQGAPQDPVAALRAAYDVQRLRLVSASLRPRPELRTALREQALGALDEVLEGVRVVPADVQLPSLEGDFRVTVANDTPYAVTVRVAFSTDQPRITVAPSDPVTVAAGSKDAVVVSAEALAPGAATLRAQLTSVEGDPVGDPVAVRVRATDFGGAALAVTLAALALLLLAATRNVVRRVRGARGGRRPGDAADGPVTSPDPAALDDATAGAGGGDRHGARGRHAG
ncbi:DUF6049 family protein [Vallicoccus soli]|uniref:DUF6049 family protein n=1 Tax=Vallicoccus soli TaxID=2339232 RepID=UPI00105A164F|nr:DUF6049 family protein [Vallicoccus soli]